MKKKLNTFILRVYPAGLIIVAVLTAGCGIGDSGNRIDPSESFMEEVVDHEKVQDQDKGIGPIQKLGLSEINPELAETGRTIFEKRCTACHKVDSSFIGPAMSGVTKRRTPEWIMNMILNPEEMVQKNETARNLLIEYGAPMANQNLTKRRQEVFWSISERLKKADRFYQLLIQSIPQTHPIDSCS